MGPRDVSILSAILSPWNLCVTRLCVMSVFINIATPEPLPAVLWVYTM